ncbi:MAG TPA: hypothetical protein VHL30_01275, partial [Chlamydiales bacterium]|nr:hypothetical protein [Chlamydiales bacterium]
VLSAGGSTELRIYTARRPQNTIDAPINGVTFVPGSFAVDSATEQWGIYYSGGVYFVGTPFTIYYKEPQAIPPPIPFPNVVANLGQLEDLLPVINILRTPYRCLNYHFQLCVQMHISGETWNVCDPIFSPYGSFILEDNLYWIGTSFQ